MEFKPLWQIEPEHFHGFTQINLGDATLLTTLQALAQNKSAIVLDQNPDVMAELMAELSSGTPVFGFLKSKKYHYQYACISEDILKNEEMTAKMNHAYQEAWEGAKSRLGNLTFVESTIENAVKELKTQRPVADLITCYYPAPQFSPVLKTIELASVLLKPGGKLVVASENRNLTEDFADYAGRFATKSHYVKRYGGKYLSAYDIDWGEKGHYETQIKNIDNGLYNHVAMIKKNFIFRAMSALGMVR